MTHRLFSRNSASSRAIPTKKLMERIRDHPVEPKWWGRNQSGMAAREELTGVELDLVRHIWHDASRHALKTAEKLREAGLHKQIANRVLEPWMFITVIVTATEYDNWFHLRCSPHAQPEIAWVAYEMQKLHSNCDPKRLDVGEWHTPYVVTDNPEHDLYVSPDEAGDDPLFMAKISTARCARVSYLTHDGVRDLDQDMELHHKLSGNGHWSPFEHPAEADAEPNRHGNFIGWRQYRKLFKTEHFGKRMP
jgi:thymidylate synthase ThyX